MSATASATKFVSSTVPSDLVPTEISAPILRALPYITALLSGLWRIFSFITSLFSPLLHLSPLPVLLYVLAPLLVFLNIVATTFIVSPYRIVVYLLDALFPLYVFCGVACITGGLLGVIARVLCRVVVDLIQADDDSYDFVTRPGDVRVVSEKESSRAEVKGKRSITDAVKTEA